MIWDTNTGQLFQHIKQDKQVCALVRGVFTKKPSQPRYAFTWDVQAVLGFIKNKWGNFSSLSDLSETLPLSYSYYLPWLEPPDHTSASILLFMVRNAPFVQFMFKKLQKDWKSERSSPVVRYYEYEADSDFCVKTILDVDLQRTKPRRIVQKKQLLMSYVNPHKGV